MTVPSGSKKSEPTGQDWASPADISESTAVEAIAETLGGEVVARPLGRIDDYGENDIRVGILEAIENAQTMDEILAIGETYNAEDLCWEEVIPGKAFRSDPIAIESFSERLGNLGPWCVINGAFCVVDPSKTGAAIPTIIEGERLVITCGGEKIVKVLNRAAQLTEEGQRIFPFIASFERRLTSNGFFVVNLIRATPEGMSKRDKLKAQRMRLLAEAQKG